MTTPRVQGVRTTVKALRGVDRALANQAVRDIKASAEPARAALQTAAPPIPLSHMRNDGPTKVRTKYGGRKMPNGDVPLVRIQLWAPGWTVAADMAAKASPGATFTRNLESKYGPPSRWAWPTVEQYRARIETDLRRATDSVVGKTNTDLKAV